MRIVKLVVVPLLIASTAGCSLFVPWTERVTVTAWSPEATIKIDDVPIGKGQAQADVIRNKSHIITATAGTRTETTIVDRHLSVTGLLDAIGTGLFLVPIIGLFSPGAANLDRTSISLPNTAAAGTEVRPVPKASQ